MDSTEPVETRTELDGAIPRAYPDVFQEPKGLPPHRPYLGTEYFRNLLLPVSTPPVRRP
jgi:hypothetical protein